MNFYFLQLMCTLARSRVQRIVDDPIKPEDHFPLLVLASFRLRLSIVIPSTALYIPAVKILLITMNYSKCGGVLKAERGLI